MYFLDSFSKEMAVNEQKDPTLWSRKWNKKGEVCVEGVSIEAQEIRRDRLK